MARKRQNEAPPTEPAADVPLDGEQVSPFRGQAWESRLERARAERAKALDVRGIAAGAAQTDGALGGGPVDEAVDVADDGEVPSVEEIMSTPNLAERFEKARQRHAAIAARKAALAAGERQDARSTVKLALTGLAAGTAAVPGTATGNHVNRPAAERFQPLHPAAAPRSGLRAKMIWRGALVLLMLAAVGVFIGVNLPGPTGDLIRTGVGRIANLPTADEGAPADAPASAVGSGQTAGLAPSVTGLQTPETSSPAPTPTTTPTPAPTPAAVAALPADPVRAGREPAAIATPVSNPDGPPVFTLAATGTWPDTPIAFELPAKLLRVRSGVAPVVEISPSERESTPMAAGSEKPGVVVSVGENAAAPAVALLRPVQVAPSIATLAALPRVPGNRTASAIAIEAARSPVTALAGARAGGSLPDVAPLREAAALPASALIAAPVLAIPSAGPAPSNPAAQQTGRVPGQRTGPAPLVPEGRAQRALAAVSGTPPRVPALPGRAAIEGKMGAPTADGATPAISLASIAVPVPRVSFGEIVTPSVRPRFPSVDRGAPPKDLSRYNVIFSAPGGVSDDRLKTYMAALEETGFPVGRPSRVGFTVSRTNVRYFHVGDKAAAERLAQAVGGAARDFTDFRPLPPQGTIEIWLKGRPGIRPTARVGAGGTRRQDPGLAALRQRLIQQLRQGDILRRGGN